MNKYIFIGLGAVAFLWYLKIRFFNKKTDEYDKLYNEILTSEKYKVKGQYD